MDPAAAAGIALAVLPLIVTVFEDYKAAIHPLLMLKHSQRQARRFGDSLRTQQTMFENECRHLLHSITRDGTEMLSDPSHHLWQDNELERKLRAYLSNSLDSCISTIQSIKDILDEIRKETYEGFRELQKPKVKEVPRYSLRI
jgi:hypothetical protein